MLKHLYFLNLTGARRMRCSVSPPESVHEIAIADKTNTILMKTTMMILDSTMTILMMMTIMKKRTTQNTSDVRLMKYFVSSPTNPRVIAFLE